MNPEYFSQNLENKEQAGSQAERIISELNFAVQNPSKITGIKLKNLISRVVEIYQEHPELRQEIMLRSQQNAKFYQTLNQAIKDLGVEETFDLVWEQVNIDKSS